MNRIALVAAAAAVLLLLTGCTATGQPAIDSSEAIAGTTPSDAPLVAETPTATEAAPVEVSATPEAPTKATAVLTAIQLTVASYGVEVMADQIKTASDYACDQLASGASEESIVALTGDIPEGANRDLVQLAASDYCSIR